MFVLVLMTGQIRVHLVQRYGEIPHFKGGHCSAAGQGGKVIVPGGGFALPGLH
ncbi:hypothetical protein L8R19_07350 [Enterobacter roggenkampii]|uniref:hypothetical protein n=1 Tax=Enterobacter roggenkampii TaxID=1812935 RepID=UPI002004A23D|nr:hypothetical protein [Enterobacter roggenkampii]MCK6773434.1 hypothetical protein [Enterobacter roggenkampii]